MINDDPVMTWMENKEKCICYKQFMTFIIQKHTTYTTH